MKGAWHLLDAREEGLLRIERFYPEGAPAAWYKYEPMTHRLNWQVVDAAGNQRLVLRSHFESLFFKLPDEPEYEVETNGFEGEGSKVISITQHRGHSETEVTLGSSIPVWEGLTIAFASSKLRPSYGD